MRRQTNPNSLANLKRGNPESGLKKGEERTKKIASMGRKAYKAQLSFREAYRQSVIDEPERQKVIIEALQDKAQMGDVPAMRLLFELLGEMKTQVDVQSDNKIEISFNNEMDSYAD